MSRPPTPEEKAEAEKLQFIDVKEFDAGFRWNGDIARVSNSKLRSLAIKLWARIPTLSAAAIILDEIIDRMPEGGKGDDEAEERAAIGIFKSRNQKSHWETTTPQIRTECRLLAHAALEAARNTHAQQPKTT